jgi:hypothetical protein
MGFIVCTVERLEGDKVRVRRLRRLTLSGPRGAFALNLPKLAASADGAWSLSAEALLGLAQPDSGPTAKIMFDLTPHEPDRIDLYELIDAGGRIDSDWTDVLLHFKLACANVKRADAPGGLDDLTLPAWQSAPAIYEQLRLEGGLSGGTWAWSKIDQGLSAGVFGVPRKA